tara:strand:- start:345 stop:647 length:303 start_codon:yes stop_codon:yes gene_type:complete
MIITSIQLTKSSEREIIFSDGKRITTPPSGSRYDDIVQEWIDAGNTPDPYVEPELSYQEKRSNAYGHIGDQLDMQYKDLVNGTTEWKDHISKVKSDIAKE